MNIRQDRDTPGYVSYKAQASCLPRAPPMTNCLVHSLLSQHRTTIKSYPSRVPQSRHVSRR